VRPSCSRSDSELKSTRVELAKETGYDGAEVMLLDAASFASVSAFVDEFEKRHDRLDILVANAGVGLWSYQPSKDGWEESYVAHRTRVFAPLKSGSAYKSTISPRRSCPFSCCRAWSRLRRRTVFTRT
jgi:NAD(P)-dependent dehydrogenase (short-subunit alcohol dehydrogenase family)